jgi:saccharopine dehydrogenase-like NADP-dependent oxidoreductase
MTTLLVLGAGRSSSSLISYLLRHADEQGWNVIVGDVSEEVARQKTGAYKRAKAIRFNIEDTETSSLTIGQADVVISLLPPHFHPVVAMLCLKLEKHLLTASYVSPEMKAFHDEAASKGLLFLNECGLDPGIDHMSAMQVIDRIRNEKGNLVSFESFTGGLIARETDPGNPWRYKFTWNPRNVVMAGQSTAKYLHQGTFKYIPYQQLFIRTTPVHVPGHGDYEGYANRDSLKYIDTYSLQGVKTMLRGTLRNKGFCSAWNLFVQLGCCDDTYEMDGVSKMSHADFIDSFLDHSSGKNIQQKIATTFQLSEQAEEIRFLEWSGMFAAEKIGLEQGTPAQILEHILNKKWKLNSEDKDQIVMWHRFVFQSRGKEHEIQASLVATGTDSTYTAMAHTVGLPLAIAAKLLVKGKISARGVVIPTSREFYDPILAELKTLGIELHEVHIR